MAGDKVQMVELDITVRVYDESPDQTISRVNMVTMQRKFVNGADSVFVHLMSLFLAAGMDIPVNLFRQYMGGSLGGSRIDP